MLSRFSEAVSDHIIVLDGGIGTRIQQKGCQAGEIVNLEHPEVLLEIYSEYIEAGAEMLTANSFGANRIALEALGLQDKAYDLAYQAAAIARQAADSAPRKVWVLGTMGPTNKSLTLASDANRPAWRIKDFDAFVDAYAQQASALIAGGADAIILETCFDSLNAKAAIASLERIGCNLPLIISVTVSDRSGRTLAGQTLEAFYLSVRHAPNLVAFGLNCSLGATQMAPLACHVASFSDLPLFFSPNAGFPDADGNYSETPGEMAFIVANLAHKGVLNLVGGCCGSTPEHVRAIAGAVRGIAPRIPRLPDDKLRLSGLEPVIVDKTSNFTNIGERTNVAGSKKFARIMAEGRFEEAVSIAAEQIEGGASVIDINMDDPMLDATASMRAYLRWCASEPAVAKAPVMIDASNWDTIVEALKNVPGRSVVNSISLKDGEADFVRKALYIKNMGAAMVVMAFDEQGQAVTFDRKVAICQRAYKLLTEAGIAPYNIIFDVNVLSIGTGIKEHSRFAVDFIEAVRWIKSNLPGCLTSGGISNLSFAFRGNSAVREAMHSVFLYHAIKAGLDMAIVNPQMLRVYDEIEPGLLERVEDLIFDRREDATSRLVEYSEELSLRQVETPSDTVNSDKDITFGQRIIQAVIHGGSKTLEEDLLGEIREGVPAIDIVEGPLLKGMEAVGDMFADGKLFLPQVVRSAKVMQDAVNVLKPYLTGGEKTSGKPRFLIATVQGDVHDIGKNITASVLQCSGFEVKDLGVMVPVEQILDMAGEVNFIGVSGLITPSLTKMEELCREMSERGLTLPLFVGGAATSLLHTSMKLVPLYANVHYGGDASATVVKAKHCLADPVALAAEEKAIYERIRVQHQTRNLEELASSAERPVKFVPAGCFQDVKLQEWGWDKLSEYADWHIFDAVCGIKNVGAGSEASESLRCEARSFLETGGVKAQVCARFFDAVRVAENEVCCVAEKLNLKFGNFSADSPVASFFPYDTPAPLGFFAVKVDGDDGDVLRHAARSMMADAASAALCEQFQLQCHERVVLPAIGYPCCPDHKQKAIVLERLPIGIALTDGLSMIPAASICGFVVAGSNR